MGFINMKTRITEAIGKYKYACIILLVGMLLMLLPSKQEGKTDPQVLQAADEMVQPELEQQLEQILSQVRGAGRVKVMLAVAQGEQTIYQTDTNESQGENTSDHRSQTILITDGSRNETGLIYQKIPPSYKGAIILAQGGDDPTVKLALVDAVSNITGLGTDKISILKMQ